MIRHVWSVLCSESVIDIGTNNVSLHSVVERLTVAGAPDPERKLRINLDIVSLWERLPDEEPLRGNARVALLTPTREVLGATEFGVDLESADTCRSRVHYLDLPLPVEGRYVFEVAVQDGAGAWRPMSEVPLRILFLPPEQWPRSRGDLTRSIAERARPGIPEIDAP
jgi:hypothetical protein